MLCLPLAAALQSGQIVFEEVLPKYQGMSPPSVTEYHWAVCGLRSLIHNHWSTITITTFAVIFTVWCHMTTAWPYNCYLILAYCSLRYCIHVTLLKIKRTRPRLVVRVFLSFEPDPKTSASTPHVRRLIRCMGESGAPERKPSSVCHVKGNVLGSEVSHFWGVLLSDGMKEREGWNGVFMFLIFR